MVAKIAAAQARVWQGKDRPVTCSKPRTCDVCGESIPPGTLHYYVDGVVVGIEKCGERPGHIKPPD